MATPVTGSKIPGGASSSLHIAIVRSIDLLSLSSAMASGAVANVNFSLRKFDLHGRDLTAQWGSLLGAVLHLAWWWWRGPAIFWEIDEDFWEEVGGARGIQGVKVY